MKRVISIFLIVSMLFMLAVMPRSQLSSLRPYITVGYPLPISKAAVPVAITPVPITPT